MKLYEIITRLERFCPKEYAADWDNVGLHAGHKDSEIRKILVSVDANDDAIDQAVEEGADLILSHHPFMLRGIMQANDESFMGSRLLKMAEHGVNCYCMHTNFDVMGGMSERIAELLGLTDLEVLEEIKDGRGIGVVGNLSTPAPITLQELCEQVKDKMALSCVSFYGLPYAKIKRVAIVPGSGKDDIPIAIAKRADVLLTGDMTYHYGIDAVAEGLTIIDAGHYGLEKTFMDIMEDFMRKEFPTLTVIRAKYSNPQQYI